MAENNKTTKMGGARKGAGRPSKADEEKVKQLSKTAMIKEFGSEDAFWQHGYKAAKESYPYYNLMMQYTYGKPKETKELTHNMGIEPTFDEVKIVIANTGDE